MRDAEIRDVLLAALIRGAGSCTELLIPEVDIRWTVPGRIDVLLVSNRITGFEIKSNFDSLSRLPRQVEAYGQVVERACLVVGEKHEKKAMEILPEWWEVRVVLSSPGGVPRMVRRRRGRLNPGVNALAVLSFVNRKQLLARLRDSGWAGPSSMTVDNLRRELYVSLGAARSIKFARGAILQRFDVGFME